MRTKFDADDGNATLIWVFRDLCNILRFGLSYLRGRVECRVSRGGSLVEHLASARFALWFETSNKIYDILYGRSTFKKG